MGVNKYRLEKEEPVEVLSIDNAKVINTQVSAYADTNWKIECPCNYDNYVLPDSPAQVSN